MAAQLTIRRGRPRAVRRRQSRTISQRQETGFAVLIAAIGFLLTVLILNHFDDLRFAFAEWGEDGAAVVATPAE